MSRASDPSPSSAAPWADVLRGDPGAAPSSPPAAVIPPPEPSDRSSPASDAAAAAAAAPLSPESDDHGINGNAAAGAGGKKPAWNVPPGGANEAGAVMGADSWPALSESTSRASAKSSSSNSAKALSDGSSAAVPSVKLNTNNTNPSSTRNHDALARQKPNANPIPMKKGGGTSCSSSAYDGPGAPRQPPIFSETSPIGDKGQESFPEELANEGNSNLGQHRSVEFMPQPQTGGHHRRGGYSGNRRGNYSGAHHGRNGSRRDHERGGYDWNGPRGFSSRDPRMSMSLPLQRGQSRPLIRPPPPPPPAVPYIGMPPHIQSFMSPMGYPEIHSSLYYVPPTPLETLRSMTFIAHQGPPVVPPAMFPSQADHQRFMLMEQIEYYFSIDNLCKDIFLRKNMDDQGWVPITLIAGFNRVKQSKKDIPYILDAVRGSTVLEVQGEKIRRRDDWMNWILPPTPNQYGRASGPQSSATSDYNSVIAHMHTFGLEGSSSQHSMSWNHNEVLSNRSASGSFNNQMQDRNLTED